MSEVSPLLPLRDLVVFPYMMMPLFVGREKSINALEDAMNKRVDIILAAQKEAKTKNPGPEDIYSVGTVGTIIQLLRLPDGTVKVLVEGKHRVEIKEYIETKPFLSVCVEKINETPKNPLEAKALVRSVKDTFENYVKLNKRIPPEMLMRVTTIENVSELADIIAAQLNLKIEDKQKILETSDPGLRLEELLSMMTSEIEILEVEKKIRSRVKRQMERSQKEYYLNEQMQAIQKELGERDDFNSDILELEEILDKKPMSEEARAKVKKEIKKLRLMPPVSAESAVIRSYIDWVVSLPWNNFSKDKSDLSYANRILDQNHYGLEKVKERILEHLAVECISNEGNKEIVTKPNQSGKGENGDSKNGKNENGEIRGSKTKENKLIKQVGAKGPILCLVGPPGVGKTSLGKSMAKAMGKNFVRVSLGGVRDEAEIRGHRKTYVGAMPGKIIQAFKKVETSNPLFLLDEIDKMSTDFRGDPSSALLEVLDPEQNSFFQDHYLELDYDLSKVMFVTTANTTHHIPGPLLDRMEIIHVEGYTENEKFRIAKKYLIPKQLKSNGLGKYKIKFLNDSINTMIRHYTREAGVRGLDRQISTIYRKVAKEIMIDKDKKSKNLSQSFVVNKDMVKKLLGVQKFRHNKKSSNNEIGLTNGMAWTDTGGDLLSIEASVLPGTGKLTITGQLGDVMKESCTASMSYVRSRALLFGLDKDFYQKIDVHVHVPEGAIPKDGPSAGVAIVTSIVSALTKIKVNQNVSMTGEITLRGRVLEIGGLKQKVLAAHRGGIKKVIFPKDNEKDLKDIPEDVAKDLEFVPVEHVDDVLVCALNMDKVTDLFKTRTSKAGGVRAQYSKRMLQ